MTLRLTPEQSDQLLRNCQYNTPYLRNDDKAVSYEQSVELLTELLHLDERGCHVSLVVPESLYLKIWSRSRQAYEKFTVQGVWQPIEDWGSDLETMTRHLANIIRRAAKDSRRWLHNEKIVSQLVMIYHPIVALRPSSSYDGTSWAYSTFRILSFNRNGKSV